MDQSPQHSSQPPLPPKLSFQDIPFALVNGSYLCFLPSPYHPSSNHNHDDNINDKDTRTALGVSINVLKQFMACSLHKDDTHSPNDKQDHLHLLEYKNDDTDPLQLINEIQIDFQHDIVEYATTAFTDTTSTTLPPPSVNITNTTSQMSHHIILMNDRDGIILTPSYSVSDKNVHQSNMIFSSTAITTHDPDNTMLLQIKNYGGFIVGDFFENVMDQILLFPNYDVYLTNDKLPVAKQKQLLYSMLSSCILTDGTTILYSPQSCRVTFEHIAQKNKNDASLFQLPLYRISVLTLHDWKADIVYSNDAVVHTTKTASTKKRKASSLSPNPNDKSDMSPSKKLLLPSQVNEQAIPSSSVYLNPIQKFVTQRLEQHLKSIQTYMKQYNQKSKSIIQSRQALTDLIHNFSQNRNTSDSNGKYKSSHDQPQHKPDADPKNYDNDIRCLQMIRLRYKVMSIHSSRAQIQMQVDVVFHHSSSSSSSSFSKSNSVHNLFLSTSFVNHHNDSIHDSDSCIESKSGVVPTLLPHQCVSISLHVDIPNVDFQIMQGIVSNDASQKEDFGSITLALNAHWDICRSTEYYSNSNHHYHKHKGNALGLVRIPLESMLLPPKDVSDWNMVDFTTFSHSKDNYIPCALYEHRNPCRISFEKNVYTNFALIKSLLASLPPNDTIDWNDSMENDQNDASPSMVIFSESPQKRAGKSFWSLLLLAWRK